MKSVPAIKLQIVHIQGPLKGQIQEFTESEILIGRNPSCHVQFPKDLTVVSRQHARIVREGNRFKLIDESSNGTFVNGKPSQEIFLKDGDVLMFAEGGPKVSFLTSVLDESAEPAVTPSQSPKPAVTAPPRRPAAPSAPRAVQPKAPPPSPSIPAPLSPEKAKVPLIIQYGPTLRSFKELPVTVGKSPSCHFVIIHPGVLEEHAQFLFSQDQYWVKDLTGKHLVRINERVIDIQAPLASNDRVTLSPIGPAFRFLGAGRLAEIEESPPSKTDSVPPPPAPEMRREKATRKAGKKGSVLKKLFQR
jgi:pSer/pThr/pTyr-binding forkhead associated (FHA) protein